MAGRLAVGNVPHGAFCDRPDLLYRGEPSVTDLFPEFDLVRVGDTCILAGYGAEDTPENRKDLMTAMQRSLKLRGYKPVGAEISARSHMGVPILEIKAIVTNA